LLGEVAEKGMSDTQNNQSTLVTYLWRNNTKRYKHKGLLMMTNIGLATRNMMNKLRATERQSTQCCPLSSA